MKFGKVIDISRKIHKDIPVWPGDEKVKLQKGMSIKNGDICNLSSINMSVHTGTHTDAPRHFIDEGMDIASLDLASFIGYAKVFELDVKECITKESIEKLPIDSGDIVLFKTSNSLLSEDVFHEKFIYIDISAASYLVEKKIKTVGVDYLSVDCFKSFDYPVHKLLLSSNIGIIEGLNLRHVKEGSYLLCSLPLKIDNADGSPVRAVLIEI